MGLLRLTRDSGYADRARAYKVILDGAEIGEIRNGETRDYPISAGRHELRLKIDWCGSNVVEFTAEGDAPTVFQVKSNLRGAHALLTFWYTFFARNSYLSIEQTSGSADSSLVPASNNPLTNNQNRAGNC